jgi:hypothetical protein
VPEAAGSNPAALTQYSGGAVVDARDVLIHICHLALRAWWHSVVTQFIALADLLAGWKSRRMLGLREKQSDSKTGQTERASSLGYSGTKNLRFRRLPGT